MADTTNLKTLVVHVSDNRPKQNVILKVFGVLRRIFDTLFEAMHESRRRQAEREIAKFVALRGGRITDDLEREVTRRLFTSDWSPRE